MVRGTAFAVSVLDVITSLSIEAFRATLVFAINLLKVLQSGLIFLRHWNGKVCKKKKPFILAELRARRGFEPSEPRI